jgi:GNAT superfamily N-acetyltransferase
MMTDKTTISSEIEDVRQRVTVRRLTDSDSLAALTELIRLAYAPLGRRNLRYLATEQTEEVTRRRIGDGECWIAEVDGRIVGTILLHLPKDSGKGWYGRHHAAKFCQFAIDPQTQGLGLGSLLLDTTIERRAREAGALEMSCDTAVQARHLIRMHLKRGIVARTIRRGPIRTTTASSWRNLWSRQGTTVTHQVASGTRFTHG